MRLSEYTDYSLRVLMLCANQGDELLTIGGLAETLQVSRNHLMKVVNDLARQGLLATTRGRGGGLRLMLPAEDINIGAVVRNTETDFRLVECFDPEVDTCTLTPQCRLRGALGRAMQAWFAELDALTLADVAKPLPARRTQPGLATVAPPRSRRAVR